MEVIPDPLKFFLLHNQLIGRCRVLLIFYLFLNLFIYIFILAEADGITYFETVHLFYELTQCQSISYLSFVVMM